MANQQEPNEPNTQEPAPQGEPNAPQDAGAGSTTTKPQGEPNGGPNSAKAAEKYREQRDEARQKAEALEKQLEAIKGKGDIDAVLKELEEERQKNADAAAKYEKDRVNVGRLAQAGCIDIDVALTLLDENGDVDALMKQKPYLFGQQQAQKGSTGLKPSGSSTTEEEEKAKAWKAAGLKL